MLDVLIEPLQAGFMQRSLIVAILVGLVCAVVGSYLMVQRLALLGDAISHSVLPGLAIAFIAGVLSTMAIAWIRTRSPIKEDAAMGILFSAFFALGVTLITVALQATVKRVDFAFSRFFAGLGGYPKFKSIRDYSGWTYPDKAGWKVHSTGKHGYLDLSKIGQIRMRGEARLWGKPTTCTDPTLSRSGRIVRENGLLLSP